MYFLFAFVANFILQWANTYLPCTPKTLPPVQYYLLLILSTIAMFITQGYHLNCIRAIIEQRKNPILPYMNIKNSFVMGFKFNLSLFILMLSVFIGILGIILLCAMIIGFSPLANSQTTFVSTCFALLIILISIIGFFAFIIYLPALCCMFAKTEMLTTSFRFIRATKLIKQDVGNYFKYVGMFILLTVNLFLINFVMMIPLRGNAASSFIITFLTSLIEAYTVFVFAYLIARSVKPECIE